MLTERAAVLAVAESLVQTIQADGAHPGRIRSELESYASWLESDFTPDEGEEARSAGRLARSVREFAKVRFKFEDEKQEKDDENLLGKRPV